MCAQGASCANVCAHVTNYTAYIALGDLSAHNGRMDPPPDDEKKREKSNDKAPRCEEELSLGHRCCLPDGHDGLHVWKSADGRVFQWG